MRIETGNCHGTDAPLSAAQTSRQLSIDKNRYAFSVLIAIVRSPRE